MGATAVLAYPAPQPRVAGGEDRSPTGPVHTQDGPVTGVYDAARTVEVFAGIPYARAPVGALRWRAPQPPEPRTDVFTADRFSAAPIQGTSTFLTRALSQIVEVPLEGTLLNPYPVSEDSLTLNIWRSTTPVSAELPVLVYIPGGGFSTGSGALPLYDGEALASRSDVVTVTINYRLGVLGFLSHHDLAAESEYDASGNYGILDQIAALQWVHDNIAAFGGDPERVTIAGQSAGGESVCILGATPLADGLVHGIIAGGGACMGTVGDTEDDDQADTPEKGLVKFGSYHGAEVMYAYDNLGADGDADYTGADHRLRDQMSAYWVSFVRTGDPNAPGLPAWPTFEQAPDHVMEFDGGSGMNPRPRPDAVDFWMDYDGPIP